MSEFQINANMNYDYSLYVPRVHSSWSAQDIQLYCKENGLGVVYRVDFTPMSKCAPTDYKYYFVDENEVYSAFIHFTEFYKNDLTNQIIKSIDETGHYKLNIKNSSEFWYLRKCNTPLGEPIYNLTQVSELIRGLENKVKEQQIQIDILMRNLMIKNDISFKTKYQSLYDIRSHNQVINDILNVDDLAISSSDSTVSNESNKRVEISESICGNI